MQAAIPAMRATPYKQVTKAFKARSAAARNSCCNVPKKEAGRSIHVQNSSSHKYQRLRNIGKRREIGAHAAGLRIATQRPPRSNVT